jgi:alpha-beta hydrolase superfamily lysophospholipase
VLRFRKVARRVAVAIVMLNLLCAAAAHLLTHATPRREASLMGAFVNIALPRRPSMEAPDPRWKTVHFAARDGTRLEAWYAPSTRRDGVVVLLHGYAGSRTQMVRAGRLFESLGYGILAPDFRGCGSSEGSATSIGFHEAQDVAGAVRAARRLSPGQPVFIYGASMGSAAALRAVAAEGVRPEALVLECPFSDLLRTVELRFQERHLPAFPLARMLVFWGGMEQRFDGFRHSPERYARRVEAPTLLMAAEGDPYVPIEDTRRIFAALAGPKDLWACEGTRHATCLSIDPGAWLARVGRFLAGNGGSEPVAPVRAADVF